MTTSVAGEAAKVSRHREMVTALARSSSATTAAEVMVSSGVSSLSGAAKISRMMRRRGTAPTSAARSKTDRSGSTTNAKAVPSTTFHGASSEKVGNLLQPQATQAGVFAVEVETDGGSPSVPISSPQPSSSTSTSRARPPQARSSPVRRSLAIQDGSGRYATMPVAYPPPPPPPPMGYHAVAGYPPGGSVPDGYIDSPHALMPPPSQFYRPPSTRQQHGRSKRYPQAAATTGTQTTHLNQSAPGHHAALPQLQQQRRPPSAAVAAAAVRAAAARSRAFSSSPKPATAIGSAKRPRSEQPPSGPAPPPSASGRLDSSAPTVAPSASSGPFSEGNTEVGRQSLAKRPRGAATITAGEATKEADGTMFKPVAAERMAVPATTTITSTTASNGAKSSAAAPKVMQAVVVSKDAPTMTVRKLMIPIEGRPESSFTKKELYQMPVAFAFRPDADATTCAAALKAQERWNATWRAAGLVLKKNKTGSGVKLKTGEGGVSGSASGIGGSKKGGKPKAAVETFSGPAPEIGPGWTMRRFKRMGGATKSREDRYWFSPKDKYRFRSIVQINRFKKALKSVGKENEREAWRLIRG